MDFGTMFTEECCVRNWNSDLHQQNMIGVINGFVLNQNLTKKIHPILT